jgi:hypothetical protein
MRGCAIVLAGLIALVGASSYALIAWLNGSVDALTVPASVARLVPRGPDAAALAEAFLTEAAVEAAGGNLKGQAAADALRTLLPPEETARLLGDAGTAAGEAVLTFIREGRPESLAFRVETGPWITALAGPRGRAAMRRIAEATPECPADPAAAEDPPDPCRPPGVTEARTAEALHGALLGALRARTGPDGFATVDLREGTPPEQWSENAESIQQFRRRIRTAWWVPGALFLIAAFMGGVRPAERVAWIGGGLLVAGLVTLGGSATLDGLVEALMEDLQRNTPLVDRSGAWARSAAAVLAEETAGPMRLAGVVGSAVGVVLLAAAAAVRARLSRSARA